MASVNFASIAAWAESVWRINSSYLQFISAVVCQDVKFLRVMPQLNWRRAAQHYRKAQFTGEKVQNASGCGRGDRDVARCKGLSGAIG